ncbi:peptidase M28 [Flavobacterium cyanobacteriorum]|uniref:Peptidase M28 n=1 Tax=Flavobacterium cyanobacteriorum TaxID=2022802 RepID=A0A255ZNC6_9FLAO|nr:M28 family peptidase [Flavobacterium cyanobacteriorum]OYQ42909.1 peptidase M28 [Flavobacterium cyanobacteriorum]
MKKILPLLCIALLSVTASAQKKEAATSPAFDEAVLAETLRFLSSDALQGRKAGSDGIEKAALYLEGIFQKNSVKSYFTTYRDTLSNYEKPAYNIVGYLEGNDPVLKKEFVIFGAHYDHVGTGNAIKGDSIYNGANDNASGSALLAGLVSYYGKNKSNKRSILFCFFSAEEVGLLGSVHLAAKIKAQGTPVYTMLNFEMVGSPLGKDIDAYITGYSRSNMVEKLNEYAGRKMIGYTDFEVRYQLFKRSDNYPFFLELNVPAHTISTTNMETYKLYHQPDDDFSNINMKHMVAFVQKLIPATEKMVNAKTKEIVLTKS